MSETQVTKRNDHAQGNDQRNESVMIPAVDVIEDAQGITVYADLPGVPKDKLTLQVQADSLSIEGELNLAAPEGMQALHAEIARPRFKRQFTLSKELDAEKVSAEFKHGVLKLHIPKAAQAQPRKINVNVH